MQLIEERGLPRTNEPGALVALERAFALPGINGGQVAALLASRLAVRCASPPLPPPDQQRKILLASAVQWIRRRCGRRAGVVACEDLQWFDPTTLELSRAIVTQSGADHLLLLAT